MIWVIYTKDYAFKPPKVWDDFDKYDTHYNAQYQDCSICLEEMNPMKREVTKSPNCMHKFHTKCFKEYIRQRFEDFVMARQIHDQFFDVVTPCPLC